MATTQSILGDQSMFATKFKGGCFTMFLEDQVCMILHMKWFTIIFTVFL